MGEGEQRQAKGGRTREALPLKLKTHLSKRKKQSKLLIDESGLLYYTLVSICALTSSISNHQPSLPPRLFPLLFTACTYSALALTQLNHPLNEM